MKKIKKFKPNSSTDTLGNLSPLYIDRYGETIYIDPLDIPSGGLTTTTVLEIQTLISTSSLVVGTLYQINGVDETLYGGTTIFLVAITSNKLALEGQGIFYTPKYDSIVSGYNIWTNYIDSNFSNIVGTFIANELVTANNGAVAQFLAIGLLNWISGDWTTATTIEGDDSAATASIISNSINHQSALNVVKHWGGKSWRNITGINGTSINKYSLDANWEELPINSVNYNIQVDTIQYDNIYDRITFRKDNAGNEVKGTVSTFNSFILDYAFGNPIKDFQWGNNHVVQNKGTMNNSIIDSYMDCLNSRAYQLQFISLFSFSYIHNNTFSLESYIYSTTLNFNSNITDNIFAGSSFTYNTISAGTIYSNKITNNSSMTNNKVVDSSIGENVLSGSSIDFNTVTNTSSILRNILFNTSKINYNSIDNYSGIQYNKLRLACEISNNNIDTQSVINSTELNSNNMIVNNKLSLISSFYFSGLVTSDIISNNTANGFNSQQDSLDISLATIIKASYPKTLLNNSGAVQVISYCNTLNTFVVVLFSA